MTTRRGNLPERAALALAAAGTTWLATLSWRGFTEAPGGFLGPLALLALVVAALGVALRWTRLPDAVAVLCLVAVTGVVAGSLAAGTPVLTSGGWAALGDRLAAAVESSQAYRAPVAADVPSIAPILILGGWACLVLVDVLAGTLRRAPLAGLPLLTIYSIPVSVVGGGVPWWAFVLTAVGFLLLLFLQQRELAVRWGRGLGASGGRDVAGTSHALRASAGSMGAAALVLAVLVPQFVPTLSLSVFGFGPGGDGGRVTVTNPMIDLRRDLNRDVDAPLIQITTTDPDPGYLRIAALTNFSENQWSTGGRTAPVDQRAQGSIPALADVDPAVPRERFPHAVTVLPEFESGWLPTAFPVDQIRAEGDWRYDTDTFDFLAYDGQSTAGLDYEMVEVELDIEGAALADAASWTGQVSRDFVALPDGFPTFVRNLAQEVTRDYPSRYEKAVALQQWFRKSGGFSYSLDNVPPGNGTDELVAFLTEGDGGRVGYCEQFAAAMAAMARSLGIPARVAVGFLTPEPIGPQTYEYSAYDMHAWPELYFAGVGWVTFEPTPADRAPGIPSYTQTELDPPENPGTSEETTPGAGASPSLGPDPRLPEGQQPVDETSGQQDDSFASGPLLAAGGGLLLVVALALLPRLFRRSRRRNRLRGAIEPAWAEVRATAVDLGLPWPEHRSPRETRGVLVPFLGDPDAADDLVLPRHGADLSPEAVEALDRLVLGLERLRYARPNRRRPEDDQAVVDDARVVLASLRAGATQKARRRADWVPASILPWRRVVEGVTTPTLVRHGGVVDHVG